MVNVALGREMLRPVPSRVLLAGPVPPGVHSVDILRDVHNALAPGPSLPGNFLLRIGIVDELVRILIKWLMLLAQSVIDHLESDLGYVTAQLGLPPKDRKGPLRDRPDRELEMRKVRIENKLALLQSGGEPDWDTVMNLAVLVAIAMSGASEQRRDAIQELLGDLKGCFVTPQRFFLTLSEWAQESGAAKEHASALARATQALNQRGWNRAGNR